MDAGTQKNKAEPSNASPCERNVISVWEHRLVWLLMLAVVLLWGYNYIRGRVDRQIRIEVLQVLKTRFPNHIVKLDRAHLEEGKSISLEGVEISIPTDKGPRPIFFIQRVVAQGQLELVGLLRKQIDVESVTMTGVEISAWLLPDTRWSVETLLGKDLNLPDIPPLHIKSGMIRIEHSNRHLQGIVCHDLKGRIFTRQEVVARDSMGAETLHEICEAELSLRSGFFQSATATFSILKDKSSWSAGGDLRGVQIHDSLLSRLPKPLRAKLSQAQGISCSTDIHFSVSQVAGAQVDYTVQGDFRHGRVEHPKLPYLLENVRGTYQCQPSSYRLSEVRARSRGAKFKIDAHLTGLSEHSPLAVQIDVENLQLDDHLRSVLPSGGQEFWDKMSLAGNVNASATVQYDGVRWKPTIVIESQDVSVEADAFPYRVEQLRGRFVWANDQIVCDDFVASTREEVVRGKIHMRRDSSAAIGVSPWLGEISFESEGLIPIDSKLIAALTPRAQRLQTTKPTGLENFVRSLHASGAVQVQKAVFCRTDVRQSRFDRYLELNFANGSIQYDNFRYPIMGIGGQIVIDNALVRIKQLVGHNGATQIRCSGQCAANAYGLESLALDFDAVSVSLEDELQRAMPREVRELWQNLQPSGILDDAQIALRIDRPGEPLDMRVEIREERTALDEPSKAVSLRPRVLPYLLSDIACHMVYHRNRLQIQHISGSHDSSYLLGEGLCSISPDGRWDALINWLPTTRLIIDQSLLRALPKKLRDPMLALDFRGPANIEGWTRFISDEQTSTPYAESWNVDIDVEDGALGDGWLADGIRGTVNVAGRYVGGLPIARGTLMLDALSVRQIPVLGLMGSFAIQGDQLLLGRQAAQVEMTEMPPVNSVQLASFSEPSTAVRSMTANRRKSVFSQEPENIHARVGGGQLTANGVGWFSNSEIQMQMRLNDADLPELLAAIGSPDPTAVGKISIVLDDLTGSPMNPNTMSGKGIVQLREANLFEMPAMAKLFRVLSIRPPDDGVFQSADIEFRLDGDQIPLSQIRLDGDLISLKGTGWTNLRQEMHLELYTYIGRRGQLAAMFGPLISQDNATLLFVEVDGTPDDLQIRRSIPGLEQSIETVFPHRVSSGEQAKTNDAGRQVKRWQ